MSGYVPGAFHALSCLILTTAREVGVTTPILQTSKQRLRESHRLAHRSPLLLPASPGEHWDLRQGQEWRQREMEAHLPGSVLARAHRLWANCSGPQFPPRAQAGHWPHISRMLLLSPNSLPGQTVQVAGFFSSPPMTFLQFLEGTTKRHTTPTWPQKQGDPLGTSLRGGFVMGLLFNCCCY